MYKHSALRPSLLSAGPIDSSLKFNQSDLGMHFAKGVTYLVLLVLGVQAAPGTKRPVSIFGEASTAKQPKPLAESPQPSRPKLLPKPNSLVGKLTVIDGSCRPTTARFVQVEQALSDAYDIVEVGQRINSEDTA